jgi:O-antigen/teichoic acid export membrane protein
VLYGIDRVRWFARASIAQAVANLALSLILVRPLGIEGVALGTCIPSLLHSLAVAWYVCRVVEVDVFEYLRSAFLKPLAIAPLLVGIWLASSYWVAMSNWTSLLAVGLCGFVCYAAAAGLVEFGPEGCLALLRRLPRRPVPAGSR